MEYIPAKAIVTRTKSPEWFGLDYNMNIYKGCSHGCIYCDSRSDCYRVENFDQVRAKENALQTIRDDLRSKVKKGVIGTGSMSDPYNPFEQKLKLTRHALELINAYGFGVAIATKSSLITRDIDILTDIKESSPVLVKITITAADDSLARRIEPGVCTSSERFRAVRSLSDAGIFSGILLMPVLPYIEDTEENIKKIVEKAHESGARFIYAAFGMTLRNNQRLWYFDKLREIFPDKDYVSLYQKKYGNMYECRSPKCKQLWEFFASECEKYGILYDMKKIVRAYKRNYECTQLSFFDEI